MTMSRSLPVIDELTCAVETFAWRAPSGAGISVSANQGAMRAGSGHFLETGEIPSRREVLIRALRSERMRAKGRLVGTQDVAAIVYGSLVTVRTARSGQVGVRRLQCDRRWLSRRFVWAFDPMGTRHHAPTQLSEMLDHPEAGRFVDEISALAREAADALERGDELAVALGMNRYVGVFQEWSDGRYVPGALNEVMADLRQTMGPAALAIKPPGAGGAACLMVQVVPGAANAAIDYFRGIGWIAQRARLAPGFAAELIDPNTAWFRAGHRLDIIGAADLGCDPAIGRDGLCVAMAVQPVSEAWARRVSDGGTGRGTSPTATRCP
jgi:hypothetical protein